ncbi:DNA topoisomerase 1 [Dispira parvispora]|uniref:DNA topoisomerase I n=1 Tax=Dispira parvispora TaxID=1520584 RepID=A0A9W8ALQ3_9FUNG|nr:DNA topoisomerase 1 [Dispira parvispora]
MNDEEQEIEYKWWLEQKSDTSVKWQTLSHKGVVFPPPYVPHNIPLVYSGQKLLLEPPAEEIASYFAQMLDTDYMKNPVFIKNFFREFQIILRECSSRHTIEEFSKCDFTLMYEHFQRIKEQKKAMTKEEKDKLKKEKEAIKASYGVAFLDGRKEKVGNYTIEPPGLFRGRGEHPKTGCYKRRVQPEDVTINIGKDAQIPEPPAGHHWKNVIHDSTVSWLAMWKDNVNDNFKYVFLAPGSSLKGQSDMKKYEMARNLKGCVDSIRKTYTADLRNKDMAIRQRATALYLIDKLALRAGNEKSDDEADTVGCCSLRYEHVSTEEPNILVFDFLGKDSVRYFNAVPVDDQVFKNIKIFKRPPKTHNDDLFDRLNTTVLNKHLQSLMPGLTAKVFRTFNASITFQDELRKHTPKDGTLQEKLSAYDKANRRVAELCNHQKGVGKSHESQMEKMQDKVLSLKYLRRRYIEQLRQVEPKMKRKKAELFEADPELTDDWILKYEIAITKKDRERIVNKFDKENAERKQNKEKALLKSDLKERLGEVIAKEKLLEKGKIPSVKDFPPMKRNATADKLLEYIAKTDDRIKTAKLQMEDKDENKTMALNTSRLNYLDPRITIAWCKTFNVPVAKRFSATQREKFRWAMDVDPDWEF